MRAAEQPTSATLTAELNGVPRPFEDIYTALASPLRKYLLYLTRDRHRAEDLLQETFLQIHRSRYRYLPDRPVEPWAFGIARHVYLMSRRAERRLTRHEVLPDDDLPEWPVTSVSAAFTDRKDLTRALIGVKRDHRQALLLHHFWGYSFREIGEMLGITECAAKLRSFRGVRSLRKQLAADHPTVVGGANST